MINGEDITRSEDYAESIINTVREPLLVLDQNLRVVTVSRSFYDFFKVKPEETVGRLIYDLGNKQWDIPSLRELLETIIPEKTSFDDYEVKHDFATIGRRTMLLNARQIKRAMGEERIILLAIEDITERKETEAGIEKTRKELEVIKKFADEAHEFADSVINTVREPLISLDQDLRVITVSRSFYDFFKVKPEETVGKLVYDLGNKQWDIPRLRELLETILPQKTSFDDYEVEHDFATIGRRIMLLNARQIKRRLGEERIILLAIEDITERRQLENLLADSEERYRRIFETASDGIVLLEKGQGHIVKANLATETMLGYSEVEYLGKSLRAMGVALDTSDFAGMMQSLDRQGILNYEDVPTKTKAGEDIWTDIYLVDRAKVAQCNIRDVSDRKRKEGAIQRLNRTLLARSHSSKAMLRAEDEVGYLNEVCRIIVEDCGHALVWIGMAEQDEGKTVRPVAQAGGDEGYLDTAKITWTDTERGRGPVGTAIRTGKPAVFQPISDIPAFAPWRENAVKRGYAAVIGVPLLERGEAFGSLNIYSRHRCPFSEDEVQLLSDLAADLSYGIATLRQRAAHAEAESALRLIEERYHYLFDNMLEGVAYCKMVYQDGNPYDFIYLEVNKAFEQLTGMKDVKGKKISEIIPTIHESNPELLGVYSRVISTGIPERFETYTESMGGWRSVSAYTYEKHHFIVVFDNITEQKNLVAQLHHSQKMEALGTLAGGIAHDFNNILSVIMGYGEIVMDDLEAGSPAREDMKEMITAAKRAVDLTARLLIFSRKQVIAVVPINLNDLLRNLQKMLKQIVRESTDLTLNLTKQPLIVPADAGQIEQVLINLAANARDAMPEGGWLTISTGLVEVDDNYAAAYGYGKPGTYAFITVADTGQGMDKETQKNIFEPFFTTKEIGRGTGLGLAISFGIIKQHDGYIKVYSEPGDGTVFKILLPLCGEAVSASKMEKAAVSIKGGNETILVAEDDASLRKFIRRTLESFGYEVIMAEDGDEAIEKFKKNSDRIDIVLLDMIMPKKNGKEVSEAIKKISPGMKIFLTSGYTMDVVKAKEVMETGFDFIHKPFQSKDLLIKVREILDR
ncbi:MAG: PAS domain S-box protein [Proteobacteria bacterium]|nr:PAS domain S-box protein [Pseudomonadota bacterium]